MALVFRKITKRVLIIINLVLACLFLLACCNAFLNPYHWWFISLMGLAFPFLLLFIFLFFILWLVFRSKWALLSLGCLALGYSNIRALIGINFNKTRTSEKPPNSLRLLTWNVTWFDEQTKIDKSRLTYRHDMLKFIKEQQADVLCFQEYVEPYTPKIPYNNRQDITALGYPYSVTITDYIGYNNRWHSGLAIYSKYPILDSFRYIYPGPKRFRAGESLAATDIDFKGKRIRVFTTHLQSVLFKENDYKNINRIKSASDSMYEASVSIVNKLGMGYKFRSQQADIVRKYVDASPYPAVICGDFNDTPNSYTYFQVRGDRKDAFIEAGRGIGNTFPNIAPTLRIDYIFTDKRFDILQYSRYRLPYSEHYPVIADVVPPNTGN